MKPTNSEQSAETTTPRQEESNSDESPNRYSSPLYSDHYPSAAESPQDTSFLRSVKTKLFDTSDGQETAITTTSISKISWTKTTTPTYSSEDIETYKSKLRCMMEVARLSQIISTSPKKPSKEGSYLNTVILKLITYLTDTPSEQRLSFFSKKVTSTTCGDNNSPMYLEFAPGRKLDSFLIEKIQFVLNNSEEEKVKDFWKELGANDENQSKLEFYSTKPQQPKTDGATQDFSLPIQSTTSQTTPQKKGISSAFSEKFFSRSQQLEDLQREISQLQKQLGDKDATIKKLEEELVLKIASEAKKDQTILDQQEVIEQLTSENNRLKEEKAKPSTPVPPTPIHSSQAPTIRIATTFRTRNAPRKEELTGCFNFVKSLLELGNNREAVDTIIRTKLLSGRDNIVRTAFINSFIPTASGLGFGSTLRDFEQGAQNERIVNLISEGTFNFMKHREAVTQNIAEMESEKKPAVTAGFRGVSQLRSRSAQTKDREN